VFRLRSREGARHPRGSGRVTIRFLIDENISESILPNLHADYAGSMHVRVVLQSGATDREIFEHAKSHGLVILTRDEDFDGLALLRDDGPKIVRIAEHNPTSSVITSILNDSRNLIRSFVKHPQEVVLILRGRADTS
jgi:predicted nuclease of predicted toxin-antitoxin system